MQQIKPQHDISNRTVVVILVLVILVSVVSLGMYMQILQKTQVQESNVGKVSLTIDPATLQESSQPPPSQTYPPDNEPSK